jgi:uncharacterized protein (DUF433 family)
MPATATRFREKRKNTTALSPAQAAYVTGLSAKTVNQAIDRREIVPLPTRRGGDRPRTLGFAEALYLDVRRETDRMLAPRVREVLYREIKRSVNELMSEHSVHIGPITVQLRESIERVHQRMQALAAAERFVVSDPEVRGGEPVVAGTRVPVYRLSELVEKGATRGEILEDHPSLTPESLEAALTYASMHRRRGRPRRAPWHATASRRRDANAG